MKGGKYEQGFTFVELIVTIVILGILVTTAAMRFIDLSNTAQAVACRTNQLSLQTAQILYFTKTYQEGNGHYAESLDQLVPFLKNEQTPQCPSGGAYRLLSEGKVVCTLEKHQL